LLGGDGDPVIGLHGLRRAGKFVFDDFVSVDGVVPLCGVLVNAGESVLSDDGDLG